MKTYYYVQDKQSILVDVLQGCNSFKEAITMARELGYTFFNISVSKSLGE